MEKNNTNSSLLEFGQLLTQLPPLQVGAVAKILGVKLVTDELEERNDNKEFYKPRPGREVADEIFNKFSKLNRHKRRELIKIIKKAIGESRHGVNSERTEKTQVQV